MQAAKKAVETIKETAANIGASAKSGLEKTKATVQEKTQRMTAQDPMQKDMATQKKEEKINQAELEKQGAREHNAEAKQSATAGHMAEGQYTTTGPGSGTGNATDSTTGEHGQPMMANRMSTMPEHHGHGHGLGLGLELGHEQSAAHMEGQYTTTGPGIEPATYSSIGEHGQGQPMGTNQMSSMPRQHGHGLGHGLGELAEEMVGTHPTGTNTDMGRTTTHNTNVGGTAPARGNGPGFS